MQKIGYSMEESGRKMMMIIIIIKDLKFCVGVIIIVAYISLKQVSKHINPDAGGQ